MSKSKWSKHDAKITELIQDYDSNSEIAKIILNTSLGAKKSKLNTDFYNLKRQLKL